MKITEAIESLNKILKDKGNLEIYLDIQKETTCATCGEPKSHTYDGFCYKISSIKLSNEEYVWLMAIC